MATQQKLRLGDLLIQKGAITQQQLEEALTAQIESNKKLGEVLLQKKYVDEVTLDNILAEQLDLPVIELGDYDMDEEVSRRLPETYARRFNAILLSENDDSALVGMIDPLDLIATDEISRLLEKEIKIAIVRREPLQTSLDLLYRRTEDISGFAQKLDEELKTSDDVDLAELEASASDAPVIKLLRSIFEDAVQVNASDIHIEPDEKVVHIRLRVDGVLQEQTLRNTNITGALTQRIKLIAGLNIAEKRLPQDGRFNMKVNGKSIDVRLSTLPIQDGESIVMRLLNQSDGILNLDTVGMDKKILPQFRALTHMPNGLVLVTGPTGSGKTTTLYAALSELNQTTTKIITIEDPVEYRLNGINQVQVKPKIGLEFASVLRTCLRQDPDIILVGEMRDQETAEIAIRAALTGHLVLSTLHTNDAASAATRLLDMGVKGYLVASTIRGVLAQRLTRIICDSCKEDYTLTEQEKTWLTSVMGDAYNDVQFKAGEGCMRCNETGYRGRTGIYELLVFNAEMLDALRRDDASAFVMLIEKYHKDASLLYNAMQLAKGGETTIAEVQRVAGG
ncbi:MAG: GspE/PulE family protein [Coxiellaceae bacterium]|nr:GspE/PulE family protein [Coxiellaceae bacterium]